MLTTIPRLARKRDPEPFAVIGEKRYSDEFLARKSKGAFGGDPLTRLAGDASDQVEVLVVVKDGEPGALGSRSDDCVRQ
jgi:hypothetical protein